MTKIVNGRVVVTARSAREAYEHVTRAYLLTKRTSAGRRRPTSCSARCSFDPEAAEERAHLAELFIRLGRLDDAAEQIARSLQVAQTVEGYLARAHLAEAYDDDAHRAQAIPALREAARLALEDAEPESIELTHLELSEAQVVALDLGAALDTARRLVDALPDTLRGRVQLAVLAWATGALRSGGGRARRRHRDRTERRRGAHPARRAAGRDQQDPGGEGQLSRRDRARGGADAGRRGVCRLAGAARRGGRGAGAGGSADRRRGRRRHAGGGEHCSNARSSGPTAPSRWSSGRRSWASPAGAAACLLGAAALAREDKPGAVAAYLGVDKREASFFEARLRAAEILRDQGKLDEAERALNDAAGVVSQADTPAKVEERRIDVAIALSQVDEKRGDAARAARRLDEALGKDGDAKGEARLTLALAAVDERRGDWQRAIARGERLLARKPRSVEALNFVGFVAADHSFELPRAIRRLQAAVVLSPGSGAIIDSLGWAYFHAGDLARADVYLEQAGRLEPGDAEVLQHLGDLYAKRQERDRALAAYRRALGYKPSERVARELGDRIRTLEAKSAAGR